MCKCKSRHNTKQSDTAKKQDLLNKKAEQYRTMDTAKKQDLLNKKAEQYKTMETAKKQDLLSAKARIKLRPGKSSSPEIQRLQFPITLAWACTVHKVQGVNSK